MIEQVSLLAQLRDNYLAIFEVYGLPRPICLINATRLDKSQRCENVLSLV